jgi:hypothetical protein
MSTMNINKYERGDLHESNYRLLREPVKLLVRTEHLLDLAEETWEGEGGALVPLFTETTTEEANRQRMTLRGARKQRAARAYAPKESIKVVNKTAPRTPDQLDDVEVAEGVKIAQLEGRVRELMGLVEAGKKKEESIARLTTRFNESLRVKVVK